MRGPDRAAGDPTIALPRWALAVAAALAGALVYATHLFLYHRLQNEPASFGLELAEAAAHFGAWAVLVPLVLRASRQWTLIDRRWPARLLRHLALGAGVALLQLLLHTLADRALIHGWRDWPTLADDARRFFARTYYANVVVYLGLVLGDGVLTWGRRRIAREAELERHLAQAQLDTLRQQLQPHFLFNALHAVSTLVADDPAGAQRMIARLADLLRHALDARNAGEVPLWRELDLAASYLAIEQVRFGDRLTVAIDVPVAAREALVPGLLLQPLLENAVRHGLASRPGPGTIEVSARVDDGTLRVRVSDCSPLRGASASAGDRLPPPAPAGRRESDGGGIGLGNVRARLRHLYGEAQALTIATAAEGTVVEVQLPLHVPTTATTPASVLAATAR